MYRTDARPVTEPPIPLARIVGQLFTITLMGLRVTKI
jgi:hypothetical protein